MNRIDAAFKKLKKNKKKAFIAYITAGYPDLRVTEKLIVEFAAIGVDIVELGVPFSDPLADGPIIQEASQHALKKNVHLADILGVVKKARKKVEIPIALMTYYNPVFCFGEDCFIRQALLAGVDGVIIPDLPPEEGISFIAKAKKAGLDTICFLSPTSTVKRIQCISKISRGFIYYVSLTGVTGTRRNLPAGLAAKVREIRKYTRKPVCVGFGVSTRAQVKEICRYADGVIVGSAIVNKIKENIRDPRIINHVSRFVRSLHS